MKTISKMMMSLVFLGVLFTACEDDAIQDTVAVKISTTAMVDNAYEPEVLSGSFVELTDMRTSVTYKKALNADGVVEMQLNKGTYNIAIEAKLPISDTSLSIPVNGIYSARMENCVVATDNQVIELDVNVFPEIAENQGFIMSEIFFNGERNSGRMMHPDQYVVIFNASQTDLYADGLCLASAKQHAAREASPYYSEFMPNKVPVSGFVTIPGTGKEHLVKAGEKLVIAFTAINHADTLENAVDLRGADFEIFNGPESGDLDNPDVANVIRTESFYLQPRGYYAAFLFKLENGLPATVKAFYDKNTANFVESEEKEYLLTTIPSEMILDGAITIDQNPLKARGLPESVDRGIFRVSGCHSQELAIRKEIKIGGKVYYQDTNNSTEDFVMRKGQTAFPIGWRDSE